VLRVKGDAKPDDPSYQRDVLRAIRTEGQKLAREANRKGCTDARRKEIEGELEDLKGLEYQGCGTGGPKHPSYSRPSAEELRFETDTPSVDEILEAAIIQRGLRSKKLHLTFAKLAKLDPARWGEVAKREAQYNPKIERTSQRIKYGDIKKVDESKWTDVDRVIAGHYFKSQILKKPLRDLSVDEASVKLRKLGIRISPQAFERALRRLCLMD
jgi:hypothetical protein